MGVPLAYVDGRYVHVDEAKVPLEDRGYLFADAVYETIVAFNGIPFRLKDHLNRLKRSADEAKIPFVYHMYEVEKVINEGIELSGFKSTKIYVQISRGVGPREHLPPEVTNPNLVATFRDHLPVLGIVIIKGIKVMSHPDIRWKRCDIKTTMLLPNILAKMEAHEKGYDDALFVQDNGMVVECTSSAFGVFKGDTLVFPELGPHILPSITRQIVTNLAKKRGFKVVEGTIKYDELRDVDEAFLCSTLQDITPIVQIDDFKIKDGKPGERTLTLYKDYKKLVEKETTPSR